MSEIDEEFVGRLCRYWHGVSPDREQVVALSRAVAQLNRAVDEVADGIDLQKVPAEPSAFGLALERLRDRSRRG